MPKFIIKTLGCKVNQYESEVIARQLQNLGYHSVTSENHGEKVDVIVVNTCTVTRKAAMQSRQATRQASRSHPEARVIVTGCHAQIHAEEIKRITGVHAVVDQAHKHKIPEMVASLSSAEPKALEPNADGDPAFQAFSPLEPVALGQRTRPFIKIQDGCDAFCTYCIVPYTRGRCRSMPVEAVLTHIARIQQAGYKEVVLTGIHLGCYGQDLKPPIALIDLLDRIHRLKTIARIRLSSIEPHEISDALIELVARSNKCPGMLCNHFHIPLQSGDDRILQKMHRPYDRKFFSKLVHRIRRAVPAAAIGVDILAGFPGETEGAFKNTYDLIAELPVTYLHVFPFSARPGTPASNYPDPIPPKIIKQRCRALRTLGLQKKAQFFRQQLGQTVEVLVEQKRDRLTGLLKGLTSNYIPVLIDADDSLMNTFATVTLEASRGPCLIGALVAAKEKKVE